MCIPRWTSLPCITVPCTHPGHCLQLQGGAALVALSASSSEPPCLVSGCCLPSCPGNCRDSLYSMCSFWGVIPCFGFTFPLDRSLKPLQVVFTYSIGGLTLWMLKIPQKSFGLAWMVFLELCMFSVSPGCSFAVGTRMVVTCDSVERK